MDFIVDGLLLISRVIIESNFQTRDDDWQTSVFRRYKTGAIEWNMLAIVVYIAPIWYFTL